MTILKIDIEEYKIESLKTAEELFYDDDILERIRMAKTIGQIECALVTGRLRRAEKYDLLHKKIHKDTGSW